MKKEVELKVSEVYEEKLINIKPYPNNSKTHPRSQIEKLKNSIKKKSFIGSILIDENKVIISGHGRYIAMVELGKETIKTQKAIKWPEGAKISHRLADNEIANTPSEFSVIGLELNKLEDTEFMVDTGFTTTQITKIWERADSTQEGHKTHVKEHTRNLNIPNKCPKCGWNLKNNTQ